MIDVSELLDGFSRLKKKTTLVGDRKAIFDDSSRFLTANLSQIIHGQATPKYDGSDLANDLITLAIQELERNSKADSTVSKAFKRDAFDLAIKFVPKLILEEFVEAENTIVITWYQRICTSAYADQFLEPMLPCVLAYFTTVTPIDIPACSIEEVWLDLWSRFTPLHTAEQYSAKYLGSLLECLGAILKIAKQTALADQPWDTVHTVMEGLELSNENSKIWQRHRLCSFPQLLVIMRCLLHEWGFTYRVQLLAGMETMIKRIAASIEFHQNMSEWSRPWSEIKSKSSDLEHAWLLLEEYASLAAPKACPIHVPSGTPLGESAVFELADTLVVKYAKASTSSHCPPSSPAACRLAARAMVVQHRLMSGGSMDEDAGAAAGGGAGYSTQLASFTKLKVASQFASQIGSQYSSQMATQRSQFNGTQKILKSRKRKRVVKMLQVMASLDFSTLLEDCTSMHLDETPTEWMRFVIECMTQVFEGHSQDLGADAADLAQMTIASTKEVRREELIPPIARLLCTIMEKRLEEEGEERFADAETPSTSSSRRQSRRDSGSGDGAAISEMWSRAHSWTHMQTCYEHATRLLIQCDRWLLSHEDASMLQPELRWSRMIEVLKPAPLSSTASIDLLQHLITSYEFDEKERLRKHEERHKGKDWPFRRELIDWLLSRDANLDISGAMVAVCSYYPKREILRPIDRGSSPWLNQECRMRALVQTQFDGGAARDASRLDTRPDTLIKELVDAVVDAVGEDPADHLTELRRLCVLQRLMTRARKAEAAVVEPTLASSSSEILNESILSVKREMELEGMQRLADRRWKCCKWFEGYGINVLDAETILRLLQHEEILDGLPDFIFSVLVDRQTSEKVEAERTRLTALTAVMRQFMMDFPEPDKLVAAVDSISTCASLGLVDFTMRRFGDVAEKLAEKAEEVVDVQTMIYKYGHMILPESHARLVDKMSRLVDDEKEEGVGNTFPHNMEEMIITHYAMEIRLEYAMMDMDRSDVIERILTPESLLSRLQLESDRGELTGECEELVKACLSPGRWEDHCDTVRAAGKWPELMQRCLATQPLLCSIMDEMAAAIDIDIVIKQEIKDEMDDSDDYEDRHKNYLDLESLWSPIQREISRACSGLRAKEEVGEQISCSMADSALPTALLLPRADWKCLQREWRGTMPAHALKILVEYGRRCAEIGMELRFLQIVEFLMGLNCVESSPYRFTLEALGEEAVWSVHSRCSERSTDFIRASTQWSRIRSRLRPSLASPPHFRLRNVLRDHRPREFVEGDCDPENLSSLICTVEWWQHADSKWEEAVKEANAPTASSETISALSTLRTQLTHAYRIVHEARCVPETAATVLPKIAAATTRGMGGMQRSTFDSAAFFSWLRLHIELWWYGRRFAERNPEEIQVIMDVYEEAPLGQIKARKTEMPPERRGESDVLSRLIRLAYETTTNGELSSLLARLPTVLPAMNLHYECLPFIMALCPPEEAADHLLMAAPDLLQERDEEREEREERRGRRREEREEERRRVGDVAVVMEECVTVLGLTAFAKVCAENGRDAEEPLADMAKLAIDSGVLSLARICIDLAAESSLPNRALFLFDPAFRLPDCLEETRKTAVIATRDAVTARSLSSATQAQEEIRRILAESRFDWHLSSSAEARAAIDEEEENYLLRFTQWTSFSKQLPTNERALNGGLVLMQKDEEAAERIVGRLRTSISSRLRCTRELLSAEVRADVRCAELLRVFGETEEREREEEESTLPSSLVPLPSLSSSSSSSSSLPSSSSHLNEECLLRVGIALAKWSRRAEEARNGGRRESFSALSGRESTHARVEEAVRHLEKIRAYKPALRLLSRWSSLCEDGGVRARIGLDEARIRVQMGEEYVALHAIEEIRKENEGDQRILARAAFLEADIVLEHTKSRERSRAIVREALPLLSSLSDSSTVSAEDSLLLHEAYVRIFGQTAKILEETQTIMESRGFAMKREAIKEWKKQLEEIAKRGLKEEERTSVRLQREVACETEEIARMESRMAQLATECIVAGLDALKSAPNTKSDTSAEILFPLLDVLFKYGQTEQVGAIIKTHFIHSDCSYFVQGVGHIVGHVFKESPIKKALGLLLVKLVMNHPFHTLPRLLFYYEAGGEAEQNIRAIISKAAERRPDVKEAVEKMVKAHFMFRDFTKADVKNRTLFVEGKVNGKLHYRMTNKVPLLRDQAALGLVPMPTVHLQVGRPMDTVPYITEVSDVFAQADGLSLPKVLTVRTNDGMERKIICKKEDVRQDAMVEHLFEAINTILEAAHGGRAHQELTTYKVVPLDINAGLIEFCGGTISLKELLCGADRQSGLHRECHPEDMTAKEAFFAMGQAHHSEKVDVFKSICERMRPVFRHYFYKAYPSPSQWSDRLDAYRRSLAQWSIVCYVVGLGDRHASNVLFEPATAKFVHIDLGMILEYSKRSLPVPERVPFRLTRDLVDPLIGDALDGHFTTIAVDTIVALRKKSSVLLGIASALLRETMSNFEEGAPSKDSSLISMTAIGRLRDKLAGTDAAFAPQTPDEQVRRLIAEATDIQNLATIFQGWMPFL